MKRTTIAIVFLVLSLTTFAHAESPDEVYNFANHLKKDGLFDAAAQQYLRFARENPGDGRAPEALYLAADCLIRTEDAEHAVSVMETLTQTFPDHPNRCKYQLELGRIYYKLARYDDADRVFTSIVVTMPGCSMVPDAMLGKAEAQMARKNYASASEVLTRLVDTYMESAAAPRASFNLAMCLRKMGREEAAMRRYENIVVEFPSDPLAGFAALEAARLNVEKGNTDRALEYYSRAKQFKAKTFFSPATNEGAALLESKGDFRTALAWYEELLLRDDVDNRGHVYVSAVDAAYRAQDYGAVRRLADTYAAQYPKTFSPQIAFTDAMAALKTNDYERATDDAQRLEAFAPGTEWARAAPRIRGEALLGQGQAREGVDELSQFVSLSGDSTARIEVLKTIVRVSFTVTHDTTAALGALEKVLDVERRQFPSEMIDVARTYEECLRYSDAHRVYEDIIDRHPLSDESETAQSRVAFIEEFAVIDYASVAARLDALAYQLATKPGADAHLRLAQARIEISKNFAGAQLLLEQLGKATKDSPQYPNVLYLDGLCHAKIARREAGGGNSGRASDERGKALKKWNELTSRYANSEWVPAAAFGRVELQAAVDGQLDTKSAADVLNTYPDHPAGAALSVRLGDTHAERGSAEDLTLALTYYDRALRTSASSDAIKLKRAKILARQGNHDAALAAFKQIAESSRSRAALRAGYEAGVSLRELKRYRDAIPYFERVVANDPRGSLGSTAALQAADCLYLMREFDRALASYERAKVSASTERRRWEVSYRIALCLKQMGRENEALLQLVDLLTQDEGGTLRPRAYETAAEVAGASGSRGAEITILESWLEEGPESPELSAASRRLVRAYLADGQAERANALAKQLARSAPSDDPEPQALVAMSLYRQGKIDAAKKEEAAVVKRTGADSELVREIGIESAKYYYDKQDYATAASSVRAYAESCSGPGVCEEAQYVHAMSLFGAQQLEPGNAAAQKFFRNYPLSSYGPLLHLRMGNVLAGANRTGESLLHYQEAAETAIDSTVAFMALQNLGISYQKLNRWGDAEKVWVKVLSRWSAGEYASEAALNLARCKMERGDYSGAIGAYQDAMPLLDSEAKARAFYWMGTSYEQLGDFQSAVVEYLKVPYLASSEGMWVVTAQLKAAECYARINRPDAARDIYTKVLNAHGANSNWGKLARKGLDALAQPTASGGGQQ